MLSALLLKFRNVQRFLFPVLVVTLEQSEKHREFVRLIDLMPTGGLFRPYAWCGNGCKPADREQLFPAFAAKAVFNVPKTSNLILRLKADRTLRVLCGCESVTQIPGESTFSPAFADFSRDKLGQKVHEAMFAASVRDKLFGLASIDATAIEAREKPAPEHK